MNQKRERKKKKSKKKDKRKTRIISSVDREEKKDSKAGGWRGKEEY